VRREHGNGFVDEAKHLLRFHYKYVVLVVILIVVFVVVFTVRRRLRLQK
jgi:hypothetical protein